MKSFIFCKTFALSLCLSVPFITFSQEAHNDNVNNEQGTVEISLSTIELKEIFQNPDTSYVCLNEKISNIRLIIGAISTIDENEKSLVHALKEHMDNGFSIGRYDAVLLTLRYAQEVLDNYRTTDNSASVNDITAELSMIIDAVEQGFLSFDAEKLDYLKDMIEQEITEDSIIQ